VSTAAILLIEPRPLTRHVADSGSGASETSEITPGVPLPCIEVLGASALQRTMQRFADAGINSFTILADASLLKANKLLANVQPGWLVKINSFHGQSESWPATEACIENVFANQIKSVFLVRLGAYAEFHAEEILQFSDANSSASVRIHDRLGSIGAWLLKPDQTTNGDMEFQGKGIETSFKTYFLDGYVNRLSNMRDLRRFVLDMFLSRCTARPHGEEVRPGIWIDDGAELHKQARVVPPAYIGKNTKLGPTSLVTRSSSVERDCNVEYGTVIEDSSILAGTYIGTGLDVIHSVVQGNTLVHLHQNTAMEINDEILIGANVSSRLRKIFSRENQLVTTSSEKQEPRTQWKGML
jgi:NDP-sugar pyrophosphorylase family protein